MKQGEHTARWSPTVTKEFTAFYDRQSKVYGAYGDFKTLIVAYCLATASMLVLALSQAPSLITLVLSAMIGLLLASLHYGTGHMAMHALMLKPKDTSHMPSYGLGTLVAFAHHFHPKPLLTLDWATHRVAHYFSPYTLPVPIALLCLVAAGPSAVSSSALQLLPWYMVFWILTPLHHEWTESSRKDRLRFHWTSRASMAALDALGFEQATKTHHHHHRHNHDTVYQHFTSFRNPLLNEVFNSWWDKTYWALGGDRWHIYLVHTAATLATLTGVAVFGCWALTTTLTAAVGALVLLLFVLFPACQALVWKAIATLSANSSKLLSSHKVL